jgi:hypothetical protein
VLDLVEDGCSKFTVPERQVALGAISDANATDEWRSARRVAAGTSTAIAMA